MPSSARLSIENAPMIGARVDSSSTATLSFGAALAACEAAISAPAATPITPALVLVSRRFVCPTCALIVPSSSSRGLRHVVVHWPELGRGRSGGANCLEGRQQALVDEPLR